MRYGGIEKRRFVRAELPCKVTVYTPTEHIITTHTENLGAGGVRVILDEKLEVLSSLFIDLSLDDDTVGTKARVVWVIDKPKDASSNGPAYDTGIEFFEISENNRQIVSEHITKIISERK